MRTENGVVIWVQWFDFSFGEEECMRDRGLEISGSSWNFSLGGGGGKALKNWVWSEIAEAATPKSGIRWLYFQIVK